MVFDKLTEDYFV